ncbi:MAG: TIGR03086 family metal-binding protein [Quadrisphaera sp.]
MRQLTTLDLAPAAGEVRRLASTIDAHELEDPTPCERMTVRQLLAHLIAATRFSAAAASGAPPRGDADVPVTGDGSWKPVLAERCDALAAAWADPRAWIGRSAAAGVETSAQEAGRAAAMELVLHGWDLAAATGQLFTVDEPAATAVVELMREWQDAEGREQAFGPVVTVAADATLLHQVLGLSGRDPGWRPAASG